MNIINGNLLDVKEGIIIQQVNCKGVQGAGLAKQIKSMYPRQFNIYKVICNTKGSSALGTASIVEVQKGLYIANCFAQDGYGRDKLYTDYSALDTCMTKIATIAKQKELSIHIPYKIGCGLAGGNWDIVSKIIETNFKDVGYTIYKLN